jgi:hypothetical protein
MKKLFSSAFAALALVGVAATAAQAQTRTWVSGVGDDLNPCSRTAPCKTFAGAFSKTAANGEINCLDPAGYGTLNITKNITISCGWTHGSVLAANTNGFIINGVGIVVTLRGLSINGAFTTTGNGVRILNAAAVNIDDVVIENFMGTGTNGRGVIIETAAANVRVSIQNSRLYNTNAGGIVSNPTGGNVLLTVDNTTLRRGAGQGIHVVDLTSATINRSSVAEFPNGGGLTIEASTAAASVSNSTFTNNGFGVASGAGGGAPVTRLYASTITGNTASGLGITSGQIISLGNNMIQGNAGNQTPSSTITTQ